MEVKRICQWCGKPFMAKKTTTNYCSPQCSKRGYKHRMKAVSYTHLTLPTT